MRIRIDLKIFIFAIIFYFTKQIGVYTMMLLFAILHELGHLLAGIILKMKPEKIELTPFGLSISFQYGVEEYNKKIKKANLLALKKIGIAIAGPITNIIIIIVASYLKIGIITKAIILYTNLLIIIFNLLPIYPLDGGRILNGILHIEFGLKKGRKYTHIISNISIIILTLISIPIIYKTKNIAILVILVFLWCIVLVENKKYKMVNRD